MRVLTVLILTLFTTLVWGQSFLEKTRRLAVEGNTAAQYNLGVMYGTGQGGAPTDYRLSHMWYNIAATQGQKFVRDNIILIEEKMTLEDISVAQEMALGCLESNYKDCEE